MHTPISIYIKSLSKFLCKTILLRKSIPLITAYLGFYIMGISLKCPGTDDKEDLLVGKNDGEVYSSKGKEQGLHGPQNEVTLNRLGSRCQERGHHCLNSTA